MELRRRDEVAFPAGSGVGAAVVAAVGVVERELHEPGEGYRAGPPDLVADPVQERAVLADVAQVGRWFPPQLGSDIVHHGPPGSRLARKARRSPGPTSVCPPSRTGIGASAAAVVSSRSHGSAIRSWSSRSLA